MGRNLFDKYAWPYFPILFNLKTIKKSFTKICKKCRSRAGKRGEVAANGGRKIGEKSGSNDPRCKTFTRSATRLILY